MNNEKPIYKKWWFWLLLLIAIPAIVGIVQGVNESKQTTSDRTETEEEKVKEVVEAEETEEKQKVIEVDEVVTSVDYTAKIQRVKIKDDILTVVFDWENQSDWDPAHFPLLGYVIVEQGGERLEQVGDTERQNKQIKRGYFDVYDLEYKLIDDSDVTIRIVSSNEYDGSEGKIKVGLE